MSQAANNLKLPEGLGIRPSRPGDAAFLESLHKSTREDLWMVDGEDDFIESLIEMQFQAQGQGYGDAYPNALHFIVEKNHERVGRVIVDFGHNEVHVIDIAFIKAARGKGLGAGVIQTLQVAAEQSRSPMALSVNQNNPRAFQLYQRLGFTVREVAPPYIHMEWIPQVMRAMVGNPLSGV